MATGTVTVLWRPGIPVEIQELKAAVVRWRGAVRYGGAVVTVVGSLEEPAPNSSDTAGPVLRAAGTGQRFRLRPGSGGAAPVALRPGEPLRIVGRVVNGGERKNDEIWLELQKAEVVAPRHE